MSLKTKSLLLSLLVIYSCNPKKPETVSLTKASGSCSAGGHANDGSVFVLDGKKFTRADLPDNLRDSVYKNEYDAFNRNRVILKEYALRLHLAKQKNLLKDPANPPPLAELLSPKAPTDKEIQNFWDMHKGRLPPNAKLEDMKPQIINFMQGKGLRSQFEKAIAKLEDAGTFNLNIMAPEAPTVEIDTKKFPSMGPQQAKIEVVEISDYTCPHCQAAHPKVKEILKKYKDKIKFTQVNFSLRPMGLSGTYIRGGHCAHKQSGDIFWKYHDAAFTKAGAPHDHSSHGQSGDSKEAIDQILAVAKTAGADIKAFEVCLKSKDAEKFVKETNSLLSKKGISSTPVFIINNKKLASGVTDLESEIKKKI